MSEMRAPLPDFVHWSSFPFEGDIRVKAIQEPADSEPPRKGEDINECASCSAPDGNYIWVSERWRVRSMERPSGLPMVLILESRSHFDLGDLPNLLAAELGVMTVRLERAVRSLDGVARVHVNRWGDGSAHLHMWFLARPYGALQLRGTFLSLWDDILPAIPESKWRENLALVAAWLAEFGGTALAEPPRIEWKAPSTLHEVNVGRLDDSITEVIPEPAAPAAVPATRDAPIAESPTVNLATVDPERTIVVDLAAADPNETIVVSAVMGGVLGDRSPTADLSGTAEEGSAAHPDTRVDRSVTIDLSAVRDL